MQLCSLNSGISNNIIVFYCALLRPCTTLQVSLSVGSHITLRILYKLELALAAESGRSAPRLDLGDIGGAGRGVRGATEKANK